MSRRLAEWPDLRLADVRALAEDGMSARAIARELDLPFGTVLSAAPDLFDGASGALVPTGKKCADCGRSVSPGATQCRRCRAAERNRALIERVRVMQAADLDAVQIAGELKVKVGTVKWAMSMASRQGLHRQKAVKRR